MYGNFLPQILQKAPGFGTQACISRLIYYEGTKKGYLEIPAFELKVA